MRADGALSYEYQGFVVDDSGLNLVAHPDPAQLNTVRTLHSAASESVAGSGSGELFETLTPEGEHVLAYVYQVETLPLKVVLELPYVTVLDAARKTAGSLLIVQITFGLLLSIAIPVLSSRITRPLNSWPRPPTGSRGVISRVRWRLPARTRSRSWATHLSRCACACRNASTICHCC